MKFKYMLGSAAYCGLRKVVTTHRARVKSPIKEDRQRGVAVPLLYSERLLLTVYAVCSGPVFFPFILAKDLRRAEASLRGLDRSDYAWMGADEPQNMFLDFLFD